MGSGIVGVALQRLRIGRLKILAARRLNLDQTVAVRALITSTKGFKASRIHGSFPIRHGD